VNTIVFATSNEHKLKEIREILPSYTVLGLKDIDITDEIVENGKTLQENAEIKARYLHHLTGKPSFSEDTGLEVDVLEGAPGVHTARYAGDERDPERNMDLLLHKLTHQDNRAAQFRTVIAYIDVAGALHLFEGIVRGSIATQKRGEGGFGYDPVFIPENHHLTFGELGKDIKNKISHRAKAVASLIRYLESNTVK
jgi:XTP/dITP diphosphohydrolase